jgi:streptogramin lyase
MIRRTQRLEIVYAVRFGLIALIAVMLSAILLAVQFTLLAPTVSAETVVITAQRVGFKIEYPVIDGPVNVAWESDGRAWFAAPNKDMIGVITRNSNASDELISVSINYIALSNGSRPYDIAYANNTIWFTEYGANRLGRIDLTGGTLVITGPTKQYPLPTADSRPSGVAVASDGMVWLVSAHLPRLTRFDPISETFTEYSYFASLPAGGTVSTADTYPDVAVHDSNVIWFTVPGSDMVLAYEVDNDKFFRLPLSPPTGRVVREPAAIVVDRGGLPWVTAYGSNLVGRYAPGTFALWKWYSIPTADSGPRGIAFQDNGATWDIWFAQENAGKLGRLTVAANNTDFIALVELAQPTQSRPWGVAAGDDDSVWYAESGRRTVSELRPPYVAVARFPVFFSSQ